ncbi:short-chain dehydrogenase/reductase SDR [Amycolatopsis mediterranei S699]|uniref:Short-chain dehydrogenase/reductase SDR n=3 Tax=Amycolatopsis mediterranei TaxID=33910 RepID=A0A0H3D6K0_AMYMU|nr:oxidoreductase [Amycolatopsis mediterranei]ADJ46630.1 short-chain dehydrogenase/reductase SDR [Amycolatopsis mediterranei U32]AEK43430.1 short-chain dehydrogenase/reductase SDR [Amycolatopsis mediterranei S699]AFO78341.1 short-chain dehydrogenase/reductase SDR [Amycolatopsis mediterranei S699]AGT85469.1 short-chain dehydrogenase/reductase SDR [Amycolatopsis mediterranei RB]KDO11468.1 3-ketoacyl-ACP reductase [Amycolatopsis mediterranei]
MTNTDGRVWLITGCSAGFGREIALAALAAGDRVLATARRPETLEELLDRGGDRLRTAALDVTDAGQIDAAVKAALEAFGRIDVVVNNAGNGSVGAVEELTMDELRALLDVMFFGAVAVTKAVLPHLRAQGSGTVVQISSMGGQVSLPGFGAYCAAKFALEGMSEALAAEVAPFGVKVLIVEPGAFRTEFGGGRMHRSRTIDAYAVSTGGTREAVENMDGTQPGDPAKAAAAIVQAVGSDDAPLRLALGADAVEAIRAHHETVAADLAAWEEVSRATALD